MSLERNASAGYLTNWAARLFARAIDKRLKALGLSSGQLPVFFALAGGVELTQKQLARTASIEQPTMAATLSRMERHGMVERRPDPRDRRSSLIRLSAAARDKIPAVMEATSAVNTEALADLTPQQREIYLDALTTVIAALSRKDNEAEQAE